METNEIQTALVAAAEEVLETMCFATIFASSEGAVAAAEPVITAGLSFHGSPSGTFRVSVPPKLARVVAAGFLGREETDVSDEQGAEVLCELANMICGSVLSRLESEATFQISHPELIETETGIDSSRSTASRWFDLGDGVLAATLELQQAA